MSILETIFPQIAELWIPLLISGIGLVLALLGNLIPFIGNKISTIGWILVLSGILFWIVKVKFTELLSKITPNILMMSGAGILLIIIAFIVLSKRSK